ncbi:MAG TPA: ABC transporter substrate-binding protein [Chloroflexota bacterium]|nr:ABC transporter substrate-binding protein [Chloroflexota bacterium]
MHTAVRRALIAAALAAALAACAPARPAPAPAAPAPAAPAAAPSASGAAAPAAPAATTPPAPVTLNFGTTSALGVYWVDYVGIDKGFYAQEGLTLDIVLTGASVGATQALAGGSLDISNHSPDSAIIADEKGADIAIVGEEIARPVYSVMAQPSIQRAEDLRGQKVAVSDLKSGATLILLRTLLAHGLKTEDVDLIPAGGTSQRYAAMKTGAVAAGAMLQPDDFRAMDEGFRRVAISTEAVPDYSFNSVLVRRDWARAHADELVRFLRACGRAAAWLYDPANKDAAIAVLMERTKQEEKYARLTYDLMVTQERVFPERCAVRPSGIQAVIELLGEVGELSAPLPPPEKYIDTSYWQRAQ